MTTSYATARSLHKQPEFCRLDKFRGLFFFTAILLSGLFLGGAILYISAHVKVVRLGYQINHEIERKQKLIEENKRLRLTIAQSIAPTQIETEAQKKFGLIPPAPGQILYLSKMDESHLSWVLAKQNRSAPSPSRASETTQQLTANKQAPSKKTATQQASKKKRSNKTLAQAKPRNPSNRASKKIKTARNKTLTVKIARNTTAKTSRLKQKSNVAMKSPKAKENLPAVLVGSTP